MDSPPLEATLHPMTTTPTSWTTPPALSIPFVDRVSPSLHDSLTPATSSQVGLEEPSKSQEEQAETAIRLWPKFAPFAPRLLRREILMGLARSEPDADGGMDGMDGLSPLPYMKPMKAALILADLSGFTALTRTLSRQGPAGVQLLTKCVNSYLSLVVDAVTGHGGEVVRFAGDAALAMFPAQGDATNALAEAVERAVACAFHLSDKYGVMCMFPNGDVQPLNVCNADVNGIQDDDNSAEGSKVLQRIRSFGSPSALVASPIRHLCSWMRSKSDLDLKRLAGGGSIDGEHSDGEQVDNHVAKKEREKVAKHVRSRSDDASGPFTTAVSAAMDSFTSWKAAHSTQSFSSHGSVPDLTSLAGTQPMAGPRWPMSAPGSPMARKSGATSPRHIALKKSLAASFINASHTQKPAADSALLSLKLVVVGGDVAAFHVGGAVEAGTDNHSRWEYFLADGPPKQQQDKISSIMQQLKHVATLAAPAQVMVSSQVAQLLGPLFTLAEEDVAGTAFNVLACDLDMQLNNHQNVDIGVPLEVELLRSAPSAAVIKAFAALRSHIPAAVANRLEGDLPLDLINEMRVCTTLFLGLCNVCHSTMQAAVKSAQRHVHAAGGTVLQVRCDEKGCVAVCVFGLPGQACEDPPACAIDAAVNLSTALTKQGLIAAAGVTTGQLFCAVVGSACRTEYTVFGEAINLAAGLMMEAALTAEDGRVTLCDETTRLLAASAARYVRISCAPALKGKQQQQSFSAFSVSALNSAVAESPALPASFMSPVEATATVPLIGRNEQMAWIVSRLVQLVNSGGGTRGSGTVIVHGGAGTGKSRILEEVAFGGGTRHLRVGCLVLMAMASRSTSYAHPLHPWRRVFRQLFTLVDREVLQERLAAIGYNDQWRKMVAAALHLPLETMPRASFVDADATSQVALPIHVLLYRLFQAATSIRGPTLLLLDDIHLLDSASWQLLELVVQSAESTGILVVCTAKSAVRNRGIKTRAVDLTLQPFDISETQTFMEMALGWNDANTNLVCLFWGETGGLPSLLHQVLAYVQMRREETAVTVTTRELAAEGISFIRRTLPLHSMIPSKMDRLPPDVLLTLKIACVMGNVVHTRLIQSIHPQRLTPERLKSHLNRLAASGFLRPDAGLRSSIWRFGQMLTRDAVYEMLPEDQRWVWHGRLAAVLEEEERKITGSWPYDTIAHHYTQACRTLKQPQLVLKAVNWWEAAAQHACEAGAYEEAVSMIKEAQSLTVNAGASIRWERCMAAQCLCSRQYNEALMHCLKALRLVGLPLPHEVQRRVGWYRFWMTITSPPACVMPGTDPSIDSEIARHALAQVYQLPGGMQDEGVAVVHIMQRTMMTCLPLDKTGISYCMWTCRQLGSKYGRWRNNELKQLWHEMNQASKLARVTQHSNHLPHRKLLQLSIELMKQKAKE